MKTATGEKMTNLEFYKNEIKIESGKVLLCEAEIKNNPKTALVVFLPEIKNRLKRYQLKVQNLTS